MPDNDSLDYCSRALEEWREKNQVMADRVLKAIDQAFAPIRATYMLDVDKVAKALEEARLREKQRLRPIRKYHVKYRKRA